MNSIDKPTLAFIINHSELSLLICDHHILPLIEEVIEDCPHVTHIMVMNSTSPKSIQTTTKIMILYLDDLLQDYQKLSATSQPYPFQKRSPTDLYSIMYTSGSTAQPKGAMMLDRRWNTLATFPFLMPNPCLHLSYAPLAHSMERQHVLTFSTRGARIVMFHGNQDPNMEDLFETFQKVKPSFVTAAPRVWEIIHSAFQVELSKMLEQPEVQQELKNWTEHKTEQEGIRYYYNCQTQVSTWTSPQKQIEQKVMKKFKHVLGGKHEYLVTGGASTSPHILEFLKELFYPVPVYDGYGTTECSGIATNNITQSGVQMRLEDCPELGYFSTEGRGEIVVKNDYVIPGYWKSKEANELAFTHDGFFRTGDIGEIDSEGRVKLIDRRKNILKLAQGEFVALESVENFLSKSDFVDQIFVQGDPLMAYLVAIVVPNQKTVLRFASQQNLIYESYESLLQYPSIKVHILNDINQIGQRIRVNIHKIISDLFTESN